MNTITRNLACSALALLPFVATEALAQQQGQVVCFSFDGTSKLSGKDNTGAASKTAARVGGKTFFVGGAGSTPGDCATSLASQLTKAGYAAKKVGSSVVCVSAGPGGAALTTGGAIATTDTGLDGINCEVHKPPPVPAKKPPKKKQKNSGVTVPKVKPGVRVTVTHTITIEIEVVRIIFGVKVTVTIRIQVRLQLGWNAQQCNQAIYNAMCRAGLCPQHVVIHSFLLNLPIPSFAIDYDISGNPVQHVLLWQPQQLDLLPMELTAGGFPMWGATSYGSSSCPGVFHSVDGYPGIGQNFDPGFHALPGSLVYPAIGFSDFEMPLFGGDLLVNPQPMLLFPPMPIGPTGNAGLSLPIPSQPTLVGLDLFSQGLVLDPQRNPCMTNAQKTTIGR